MKANAERLAQQGKNLEGVVEKRNLLLIEKEMKGQSFLLGLASKLDRIAQMKEEEGIVHLMRCEENQLRLQDARLKKARIDRQGEYRREKLMEQLHSNHEQLEIVLGLKEHLLNQRR